MNNNNNNNNNKTNIIINSTNSIQQIQINRLVKCFSMIRQCCGLTLSENLHSVNNKDSNKGYNGGTVRQTTMFSSI